MATFLQLELLLRILLAAVCGSAIGLERGIRKKEAGQRTHCILCVGACAFMLISTYGFYDYRGAMDLTQIACQIVCGVGFLGVGIIYKSETHGISGLSTATGLWATAAIGIAIGVGFYAAAAITAVISLFTFICLTTFERGGTYGKYNICFIIFNIINHISF